MSVFRHPVCYTETTVLWMEQNGEIIRQNVFVRASIAAEEFDKAFPPKKMEAAGPAFQNKTTAGALLRPCKLL